MRQWGEVLDAEPKELELAELLEAIRTGQDQLKKGNECWLSLTEGATACEDKGQDKSARTLREMAKDKSGTMEYLCNHLTRWTAEYDRREQNLALAGERAEQLLAEAAGLYDRVGLHTLAGHVKLTALRLKQARTGTESEETDPRDLPEESAGELNARILTEYGCTGENRCDCELCSGDGW